MLFLFGTAYFVSLYYCFLAISISFVPDFFLFLLLLFFLQSLQGFVNKHLSKLSLEVADLDSQVLTCMSNMKAKVEKRECGYQNSVLQPVAKFVANSETLTRIHRFQKENMF